MVHDSKSEAMFPHLPVEKIREMCSHGKDVRLRDGEAIFVEGQKQYPFCLVLEGRIRITKHGRDGEMVLIVHEAGQFTGEISLLTGAPAAATGKADGDTRVAMFDAREFRLMLAKCPELSAIVLRAFAARARDRRDDGAAGKTGVAGEDGGGAGA